MRQRGLRVGRSGGRWAAGGLAPPRALPLCFGGARSPNSSPLPLGSRLALGFPAHSSQVELHPIRTAGRQARGARAREGGRGAHGHSPRPDWTDTHPNTAHCPPRRGGEPQDRGKAAGAQGLPQAWEGRGQSEMGWVKGQVRATPRAAQPETPACPAPSPTPWSDAHTATGHTPILSQDRGSHGS